MSWTITELADEYGVTLRTLRHYEDLGLLAPERVGTARVYHQRDRIRFELIRAASGSGSRSTRSPRSSTCTTPEPGEAGQLRYLIEQIAVRRAELEQKRRDIDDTLVDLDEVEARCRDDLRKLRARG